MERLRIAEEQIREELKNKNINISQENSRFGRKH